MLYMVEMDMPHVDLLHDWHEWYEQHIFKLLKMPGFINAQRFVSVSPTPSPYLAIYSISDETALTNPIYTSQAGPQSAENWAPHMSNWSRNLFNGVDRIEEVLLDKHMAVYDRYTSTAESLNQEVFSLKPIGLDYSILERNICFASINENFQEPLQGWSLRKMRPLSAMKYS